MGLVKMKEYPPFWHGHEFIWIPSEERRIISTRFHRVFSPMLKENGFVRKGNAWWRILNGDYLQGICFDTSPQRKYIDDLVLEYSILPLYAGVRSDSLTAFMGNHHLLTGFLYPGHPEVAGAFSARIMDEEGLPGEWITTPEKASCSFFNALHDSEAALGAELEIFCERTLPAMDQINSPESYLCFYETLQHTPHAHISSEKYISTQLLLGNWKEAERGVVAASLDGEQAVETMVERLTFRGSENYISNLLGQAVFSAEQRYDLARALLTMKYPFLPAGRDALANQHIDRINAYLSERPDAYIALRAIRAHDEAWLHDRIRNSRFKSSQMIARQLPRLLAQMKVC